MVTQAASRAGVPRGSGQSPTDVRPEVIAEFRKHTGSVLAGIFGGAAFDQVALPPVAAAVDRTGRFAENFADRAVRSGFSALLAVWGDPADRAAEAQWLKLRHRDVRGRGTGDYTDVRYSALNPDNWKWIAVSGMMLVLNTFTFCTGTVMRRVEQEAAYQMVREGFVDLELESRAGKLPATLADAEEYYDQMVETKLASSPFMVEQFAGLNRLPLPTLMLPPVARTALTPLWWMVRPVAGHVIQVCSSKAMKPQVQAMTGYQLKRRHDAEFAVYVAALQTIWRVLPDRMLLAPLAYNRLQYEKLVRLHRSVSLDTFAPPEGKAGGCPV